MESIQVGESEDPWAATTHWMKVVMGKNEHMMEVSKSCFFGESFWETIPSRYLCKIDTLFINVANPKSSHQDILFLLFY